MNTCSICDENYNKSTHLMICCPYCQEGACRKCIETYLLNVNTPCCMFPKCKKEWTRQFVYTSMTKTFINTKYKTHIENTLFDIQYAMLPETQAYVSVYKYNESLLNEKKKVSNEIRLLKDKLASLQRENELLFYENFCVEFDILKSNNVNTTDLAIFCRELEDGIRTVDTVKIERMRFDPNLQRNTYTKEVRVFHKKCGDENCRGYLSSWKCGLCGKKTCKDCHEFLGNVDEDDTNNEKHVCNPNNVETAKLLARDTKPCPNCATLIYKIDGCDQMWCTQCHYAFSWKTGQQEKKIHNPHYYQWLRETSVNGEIPRNPEDNPMGMLCGGNGDVHIGGALEQLYRRYEHLTERIVKMLNPTGLNYYDLFNEKFEEYRKTHPDVLPFIQPDQLSNWHRQLMHNRYVVYQNHVKTVDEYEKKNRLLRVDYLLNKVDKLTMKKMLKMYNKKYLRDGELVQIWDMFFVSFIDIFNRAHNLWSQRNFTGDVKYMYKGKPIIDPYVIRERDYTLLRIHLVIDILFELNYLVNYTNKCFYDVYKTYGSTAIHQFDISLHFININNIENINNTQTTTTNEYQDIIFPK